MIESLDRQAKQIGVTRQSIIKVWLAERIQQERRAANAYWALPALALRFTGV